jgi:hypothetical protein
MLMRIAVSPDRKKQKTEIVLNTGESAFVSGLLIVET